LRSPACDLRTTVLGTTLDLPFLLAPVGFSRMFYPKGELHAARAANDAGTAYVLSTFSGTRLEEVSGRDAWSALVPAVRPWRAARSRKATMARARAAGYTTLVVTVDTPVSGMRERDFRHGVRPILQG
jgi:L-lactate dehydrogenase (cytochrome)